MARAKKKVIANVSVDQAQESSASYANAHVRLSKIEAKMNEEINKVKSKYQDDITSLQEEKEEHFEILEVYAKETKETWGKKKSLDMLHSVIGFRTGMPKVVKDKKFSWDAVTELVSKFFPQFVRSKNELDKESLIAWKEAEGFDELKKSCFIDIVQDETFYVEPKVEDLQTA